VPSSAQPGTVFSACAPSRQPEAHIRHPVRKKDILSHFFIQRIACSHGLLVKLPVIFEMHIGTVSGRVKAGPLRQSRFGNGNGTYIRFFFPTLDRVPVTV